MSDLAALKAQLPIDRIAAQIGADPAATSAAIDQLLPALVGGLGANAADPAGAASIERALGAHRNDLLDGGVDPERIDTADGQKIVRNIFGSSTDQVVAKLGSQAEGGSSLIKQLLPILAPIVLSWLASQLLKKTGQADSGSQGSGGLGDILGGILGGALGGATGGSTSQTTSTGGSNSSGVQVPDVFGTGSASSGADSRPTGTPTSRTREQTTAPQSEQGGLGDLLGGLLGGGKR